MHINQGRTETLKLKYNGETLTVMVNLVQINKTTTLSLPTEEEWSQTTSQDHDLGYIKRILSSP